MSKSIMSNDRKCYVCGYTQGIHKHHIFFGTANRKISEQEGCWCYLCMRHHNGSNDGVHFNNDLNLKLKRECQERWEHERGSRGEFILKFGKSYL